MRALIPFVLLLLAGCSTPEINHGSVCVVLQWIPIDPSTGEAYPNIPPKTFITCDSDETARRIFQEAFEGQDS